MAVPTGIKIFNWLATMYGGKLSFEPPMLFCIGFLFQFLIAGLTGVMLGVAPFDWQLHDSYFVVAHFHYTLVGGFLFAIFAGIYYWYPKAVGRMPDRRLGVWHFWLFAIGFHLTFDPQHFAGFLGMPRRIYTYEEGRGWEVYNLISSVGVVAQGAGIMCLRRQPRSVVPERRAGGRRPVGRVDARMGDHLTAPRVQLRDFAGCAQQPPALGLEAPGGPGLEICE